MKSFLRNVLYSGLQDSLAPEHKVKLLFINSIIFFGLVVLTTFGVGDLSRGDWVLGGLTLSIAGVVVALYGTIWVTKSFQIGTWFLPFLMFAFYTYLTISGGAKATTVLWILTYPVIVVFLVGSVWGSVFAGTFFLVQLILFFVPGLSPTSSMELEFKMRMVGVYAIVFTFSMAFETIRSRAQSELIKTAAELAEAKVQTDGILTNVNEGIFLLGPDLTIAQHHSRSLAALLDLETPGGKSIIEGLSGRISPKDLSATRDYLEMFFLPAPPWHLMEEINPLSQIAITAPDASVRHLVFTFGPVELPIGRRILGTVRDVTQSWELSRKLKEEEDKSARQMRHLFQIIHVKPELLLQFLQDADEEVSVVNRRLKDPEAVPAELVEDLFQAVHAIKGNAALVGLSSFAGRVHELENKVVAFRDRKPEWQDFLEMTVGLSLIQSELTELRDLLGRMATFQRGIEASSGAQDLLSLTLKRAVERLSRDTGKPITLDDSSFHSQSVPEALRKTVKDVLVQLVRNSFSHGLETLEERQGAGKAPQGRIKVNLSAKKGQLSLAFWDDGRGIDLNKLRRAARASEALTDDEVLQLVFQSGISTAEQTTLHSGRGVGLSLVRERVEAAGGRVHLRSVPGKGVAFDITLPLA